MLLNLYSTSRQFNNGCRTPNKALSSLYSPRNKLRCKTVSSEKGRTFFSVALTHFNLTLLFFAALLLFPNFSLGESAKYFYDRAGRLDRVIKDGSGEIYSYDKLGNLLAIQQETTSPSAPVITAATPDVIFIGDSYLVKLIGDNLLSTESVTSAHPYLSVNVLSVSNSQIIAEMSASTAGIATVTVSSEYGQDSVDITISDSTLTMSPGRLILKPGGSGAISVKITPPITSAVIINLSNSYPQVAEFPQSVTIPITGENSFTVSALEIGTTDVTVGSAKSVVVVTETYTGEFSGLSSLPVSIRISTPQSVASSTLSKVVSVRVETPQDVPAPTISKAVSVRVETPQDVPAPTISKAVSVRVETPQNLPALTVSELISVAIQ